jgi:hypothetical protein
MNGSFVLSANGDAEFDQSASFLIEWSGLVALFAQRRERFPHGRIIVSETND